MKTFLFQGDSITDADRNREVSFDLGYGYPNLFASEYLYNNIQDYEFINKGISGNRIVDVYARMKVDIINLKPDYMSLLIGVNDVWHEFGSKNGVENGKFKKILKMLLTEIKEELPKIKIILLEPFVLEGDGPGENYKEFRKEVELRAKSVKEVADEMSLSFVPLQKELDEKSAITGASYWLRDGVHPSYAGHQLIKEALKKEFEKIK